MKTLGIITVVLLLLLAWHYTADNSTPVGADPQAWAVYEKGNDLLGSFRYPQAEESLLHAISLDPSCAMAHAALAGLYLRTNDRTKHLEMGTRADSLADLIQDDKLRSLVQLRLANFGLHSTNYDSLLEFCSENSPDDVLVLATRAGLAARENDLAGAAEIWLHCLDINPNYAQAYNELGYNAAARGEYEKAIKYMRTYAYVASDLANPHDSMGDILSFVGRYEEAIGEYRRALEIDPDFYFSMINIARVYMALGNVTEGTRIMEQVRDEISKHGGRPWIDGILLDSLFLYGPIEARNAQALKLIAANDNPLQCTRLRAFVLAGSGRLEDAQAVVDSLYSALAAESGDKQLTQHQVNQQHSAIAILLSLYGDAEAAVDEWRRALDFGPEIVNEHRLSTPWSLYAEDLLKIGRYQEALELSRRMLRINPRLIRPLLIRATAAIAVGETAEAGETIDRLQVILANADQDIPAQDVLAELLELPAN